MRTITKIIVLIVGLILMSNSQKYFCQTENKKGVDNSCIKCHLEEELMPEDFSTDDVHNRAEISCSGCHGGDPFSHIEEEAMNISNNFIGIPRPKDIPQFCGKCHSDIDYMRKFQPLINTDQETQYFESKHGKNLQRGDQNVANCISCHSAHSILPASDPRSTVYPVNIPATCDKCHGNSDIMTKYGLASNQSKEYVKSVHGNAVQIKLDLNAPTCNDCHGNHGAKPPGVISIANICGSCHLNNLEYFNKSKMVQAFKVNEIHSCQECHGYHSVQKTSDQMLDVTKNSICLDCHEEGDEGYNSNAIIFNKLNELSMLYDSLKFRKEEVIIKGMNDIEISFLQKDIKQKLIESRTSVHSFDSEIVSLITKEGIDIGYHALMMADKEIEEYYYRRYGFIYFSIIFISLIVLLYLKIRKSSKVDI